MHLKQLYHSLSTALSFGAAASLIQFSSLGHQAHAEQLVHHAPSGPPSRELLQDVTQDICANTNAFNNLDTYRAAEFQMRTITAEKM